MRKAGDEGVEFSDFEVFGNDDLFGTLDNNVVQFLVVSELNIGGGYLEEGTENASFIHVIQVDFNQVAFELV